MIEINCCGAGEFTILQEFAYKPQLIKHHELHWFSMETAW